MLRRAPGLVRATGARGRHDLALLAASDGADDLSPVLDDGWSRERATRMLEHFSEHVR